MNSQNTNYASTFGSNFTPPKKVRGTVQGSEPAVLTDVYLEEINMATWERRISLPLKESVNDFIESKPNFRTSMTVSPQSVLSSLGEYLAIPSQSKLCEDIAELVDMFCCLFDLKRAGLRLAVLDRAMCPRFHVDRVPCRLLTTYQGVATEWLAHQFVNREKLGAGNAGKPDLTSGLIKAESDIQHLACGDVALLKGELWDGNENAGLVHRSPEIVAGESRLVLTLDFSN